MHEQLTTSDEFHDEEDLKICLEYKLHAYKERVIGLLQDIFLKHCGFNLIVLQNNVLSQGLHGINCLSISLLHQKDLSKTTLANNLDDLESVQTCRFLILF